MEITIDMRPLLCWECFCNYVVPAALFRNRSENEEAIYCPSCGKENVYIVPEPERAPLEERQKQIQVIHDLEQAEARIAEAKALSIPATATVNTGEAVVSEPADPQDDGGEILEHVPNVKIVEGAMQCPHCKNRFRLGSCFAKHLRASHADEATAAKVQSRRIYSR